MRLSEPIRSLKKNPSVLLAILATGGFLAGGVFAYGWPAWLLTLAIATLMAVPKAYGSLTVCFTFFMPFFLVVYSWFLDANPGNLSLEGAVADLTKTTCLLLMAGALSLAMLPVVHVISLAKRQQNVMWLLAVPAAWVLCEWFRSIAFSVVTWGPGASIGNFWQFGNFGLADMGSHLGIMSRVIGMSGLSFLLVLSGVMLYALFALAKQRRQVYSFVAVVAGLVGILLVAAHSMSQPLNFQQGSLLQQDQRVNLLERSRVIVHRSSAPKAVIVLPEYSDVFLPANTPYATNITERLAPDGVSLTVGRSPGQRFAALEVRNNRGELIQRQPKQLLIPTGESLPTLLNGYFRLTGQKQLIDDFEQQYALDKGAPTQVIDASIRIGAGSCSGILSPSSYRQLANSGAQLFTNSASLVLLGNSAQYYRQSLLFARFDATANNRTFIQASQGAPAFVLNGQGQYIVRPNGTTTQFIDFSFPVTSQKTFYTRIGEWVLPLSAALLAVGAILKLKSRRAKKS